jgi:hypothetical protein
MVEKLPLNRATSDTYERVLDKGITVSAAERMSAIAVERDASHTVVITFAESYFESKPVR